MGETDCTELLQCSFNKSVRIEGRGERLSTNTGALLIREIDEVLGFTAWLSERVSDPRNPDMITHPLVEILRSRLYLIATGHGCQDAADWYRDDPALRLAVSERRGTSPLESPKGASVPDGLASQPTQSRLLLYLSDDSNFETLSRAPIELVRRHMDAGGEPPASLTIDVDSYELKVHGEQPGSAYNGYFRSRCYHPLMTMLGGYGFLLSTELRPGNVHTAAGATDHVLDAVSHASAIAPVEAVRGDAGFPNEELLSALEAKGVNYAFRIRNNSVLESLAEPHLRRPPGRRPNRTRHWTHDLAYCAKSWSKTRRIVLVVKDDPGELFLDYFFIVTNWDPDERAGEAVLQFYRERGTAEAHLGELKSVLSPALSSSPRPKSHYQGYLPDSPQRSSRDAERANAVTLGLYTLGYNLMNSTRLLANLAVPREPEVEASQAERPAYSRGWSLAHFLRFFLLVASRLVKSGRRATIVTNRTTQELWAPLWKAIRQLTPVSDLAFDTS